MTRKYLFICFLVTLSISLFGTQKIVLTVDAGMYPRKDCVVSADISELPAAGQTTWLLYETTGIKKQISSQVIQKEGKTILSWILDGATKPGEKRTFSLEEGKPNREETAMKVVDNQEALILKRNGKNILEYKYTFTEAPAGADKAYGRSGYIHPAYSPSGNILTTIQPKGHYHHYGIWNPWTRVEYKSNIYDLWNLGDKQGTVKARDIHQIYEGDVIAGYTAGLDHYIFTPAGEQIIMDETWGITAYNVPDGFLWDFDSSLRPITDEKITIKEYRYGGFCLRGAEEWSKDNSIIVTSEGVSRQQVDGSTARWVYVTGQIGNGRSGVLFLGHPENYNHPEPLRVWDEDANGGKSNIFINIAPTKYTDWELFPGQEYELKYRVLTYDGEMSAEWANELWNDFAFPPTVQVGY